MTSPGERLAAMIADLSRQLGGARLAHLHLPEESTMSNPDQPDISDLARSIEEADVHEAVGLAIGAASMCWDATPIGVYDSIRANAIWNALIDRIWEEPDLARARARDADTELRDAEFTRETRRQALSLAVDHAATLIAHNVTSENGTEQSLPELADQFHDFLTDVRVDTAPSESRRGIDALIPPKPED